MESAPAVACAAQSATAFSPPAASRVLREPSFLFLLLQGCHQLADPRVQLFVRHELNIDRLTLGAAHLDGLPCAAFQPVCDLTRWLGLALDPGPELAQDQRVSVGLDGGFLGLAQL